MPEPNSPGAPESAATSGTAPRAGDPLLGLEPGEIGDVLFPDNGPPASDDAPTIISKNQPSRNGGSSNEAIMSGSLHGRTLAHFELIEPIGVGGMAAVIRARDKHLDRPVALKILPPEMAVDPENVRRFHQEARAAAKLDHENIARVFFCGEDQRLHFIAFEFVEGLNLRAVLERRGRLPVPEAVHYMLQIATGLAHAASRGVVHRDIKPSNIIISPNGRAKLVDMGLARNMGPQTDKDLTQSGVTLGTFDYIAPEQAMDPRDADVRSDIYALGCTFYHMLTGQPPVPEGTAARKLHHHQHVAPVDPRQLNPDIPDEVAAILVRMMAKDPKDRYQRAEHLVQHLIQVAQKLGAVADMPDGVLFVDAPLPTPPRKRPLLMVALAMLGLGIALIVLSFAPGRPTLRPMRNQQTQADVKPTTDKVAPQPELKKDGDSVTVPGPRPIASEVDLRNALADRTGPVHLALDRKLTLTEGGLTLQGKADRTVLIEGKDGKPATLRIAPNRLPEPGASWAGLELDGGTVTFKNIVFEIDADATPKGLLAGVLVKRARLVTFVRCKFTQSSRVPLLSLIRQRDLTPIASVAAWNLGDESQDKPNLVFKECYFERGQTAVALVGAADVQATDCAFGDHVALFHLRGDEPGQFDTEVKLFHVSAFLVHGPAFRLDNGATCKLNVGYSLFSCPDGDIPLQKRDQPDLIRQTDTRGRSVRFTGRYNCYHNLNALWVRSVSVGKVGDSDNWDTFRTAKDVVDEASTDLPGGTPWAASNPLTEQNPKVAFQINPRPAALRYDGEKPIGVRKCIWGDGSPLPAPDQPRRPSDTQVVKLKPNEKVVDPASDGKTAGVYSTIQAAIADVKSGDVVVLIRHTGPLPISPIALKGDQQRVTLRPYPDHRPVLTLAASTPESEAALFTLFHGQLRFENVDFHLKPDRDNFFKFMAIVALAGNGQCSFKQCLVTLERPDDWQVPLSAVTLLDSKDARKMSSPDGPPTPVIRWQQCFVRGEGDLLHARPSRAFELYLDGTLAALTGSLVSTEGGPEELGSGTAAALVKLNHVTTYLGEHLIDLRAGGERGPVFTQVNATDCLFAAAAGKSLIHLHGPGSEEQMKKVFGWAGKGNTYSGFEKVLSQQAAGEMMSMMKLDQDQWKEFAREEPQPRFAKVKFAVPALTERPLSQAMPDDFRGKTEPATDLQGSGSSVELLPRPGAAAERGRAPADGSPGDE